MVAATWTHGAEDITSQRSRWDDFLTIGQLADRIGLRHTTIKDGLSRRTSPSDARSAIRQPAARIGAKLGATPMWAPEQADLYNDMKRREDENRPQLPVLSAAQAADRGLATIDELVEITGRPDSSLRRWARENQPGTDHPFPPAEGIADRVPPLQFGPPRMLRSVAAVQEWIEQWATRDPVSA